jgi:predicted RNase H-like HicB family nuclease
MAFTFYSIFTTTNEVMGKTLHYIELDVQFIKDGSFIVAYNPQLNISSFGETIDEANEAFNEMVKFWLEEAVEMGNFEEIMKESGFEPVKVMVDESKKKHVDNKIGTPGLAAHIIESRKTRVEYAY